jgi:hypothetical protein
VDILSHPPIADGDEGGPGSGGTSAYRNGTWDLILPALARLWISAVLVERFLAETWDDRPRLEAAVRALPAVLTSWYGFIVVLGYSLVCR